MADQDNENAKQQAKTAIPISGSGSSNAGTGIAASDRTILYSDAFEITPNPSPADVINMLARLANFGNLYIAEALRSRVITAANPAAVALMNSAATLEQGAVQLKQMLMQQAGFAGGQGAGPGPGGPGMPPFRMN